MIRCDLNPNNSGIMIMLQIFLKVSKGLSVSTNNFSVRNLLGDVVFLPLSQMGSGK
jgi:hypothetical protein